MDMYELMFKMQVEHKVLTYNVKTDKYTLDGAKVRKNSAEAVTHRGLIKPDYKWVSDDICEYRFA